MARVDHRLRATLAAVLVVSGLTGCGGAGGNYEEAGEAPVELEESSETASAPDAGDAPAGLEEAAPDTESQIEPEAAASDDPALDDVPAGASAEGAEGPGGFQDAEVYEVFGVDGGGVAHEVAGDGAAEGVREGAWEVMEPQWRPPPPESFDPPVLMRRTVDLPEEARRAQLAELVDRDLRYVSVFYGTNRGRGEPCSGTGVVLASTGGACPPAEIYGATSETLEVGTLKVTFPPDHQAGEIERPMEIFGIQLRREDPDKDVVLAEVRSYGGDLDAWAADLRATQRKRALLYVHGFATTFETAAHTVAQISYDIDFDGLPMMYSWSSAGAVGVDDYVRDYDVVRLAVEPFQEFLRVVAEQGELDEIHVLAHSMGNQLVGLAFREMALAGEELPGLAQLVLAAPDVDAQEFRSRYAPRFPDLFRGVTVYVSDDDWALEASKEFRSGLPRAGAVAGGLLTAALPGIEVIDATGLPADFLDHSYFAANDSVRSDLYCVIRAGVGAAQRPLLDFVAPSWRFKTAEMRKGLDPTVCPTVAPAGAVPADVGVLAQTVTAERSSIQPAPQGSPAWLWWAGGLGLSLLLAWGIWVAQRRVASQA